MSEDLIDAVELPFSEEEFYKAFRLAMPEEEAREVAMDIGSLVRGVVQKNARAEEALRLGVDPAEIERPVWVVESLYFAFLTLVSDDLRERADRYMQDRWEAERPNLTQAALHRAGMSVLAEPTPEITAQVGRQIAEYEAEWRRSCEEAGHLANDWTTQKNSQPNP